MQPACAAIRLEILATLEKSVLPMDYRSGFASLLKEAMRRKNPCLFDRYYGQVHTLKPFTFSAYFPGLRANLGELLDVGNKVVFRFSTASPELAATIYNGLRDVSSYPLFDNQLFIQRVVLLPQKMVSSHRATFKTSAPVLVNCKGNPNWYLLPGEEGFEEALSFAVRETARIFLHECYQTLMVRLESDRSGKPPEHNQSHHTLTMRLITYRRKVVRHYNMNRQGFVGTFELSAEPALLNLIYAIGLGVHRSQGFGMLEVVPMTSREASSMEETSHE
jgi:CRISPR-associated endoribonuclease Cas6